MPETHWLLPFVFLAVGLAVGIVLVWRLGRSGAPKQPLSKGADLRDLLAERDILIARLREMGEPQEDERPALAEERAQAERACAEILRTLDRKGVPEDAASVPAQPLAQPAPAPAPGSALRGFFVGVAAVLVLGGLLYFASKSSAPASDSASMSGSEASESSDQEIASLKARVAAKPDDIEARLDLARLQLHRQDMMDVFENTRYVLERDPHNARALSYQALVRFAMGQPDQALSMLRDATTRDPELLDGWVHLLFVEVQTGQKAAADKDLAEAIRRFPEHADRLRSLVQDLAAHPGGEQAAAASGAPSGAAAEQMTPTTAAAPPAQSAQSIAGQIDAAEGVRAAFKPGSVIFLIVRAAGETSGMPLAAKKLPASRLPVAFEIGGADSMMGGGALPPTVSIEARLDSDGDPSTHNPSDPVARADGVALGTAGLRLLMQLPKE